MQARAGHQLTEGQIQQLQWVVPSTFAPSLLSFFRTADAVGAKLRCSIAGTEHWLGLFELDRMVDEVLRCPYATLAQFSRLLPFAGCGRRRTAVYLVDVTDATVWLLDSGKAPVSLGITLETLWASACLEPRVSVRRRLPPRHVPERHARVASKSTRTRVDPPCPRTLSLFPTQA